MTSTFQQAFQIVLGSEGGYSTDQSDPGNWTGGQVGVGTLRGTKYGISAAAYPNRDIANLSQDQAMAIYLTDYWSPIKGNALAPPLALIVFDAAVNNGVGRAVRWLQHILGVLEDGNFGPVSLAALNRSKLPPTDLCAAFMTQRLRFMAALPLWDSQPGWAARLCALPFKAMAMTSGV